MGLLSTFLRKTPLKSLLKALEERQQRNKAIDDELKLLPERIQFFKSFLQPGELVFEVGANVGNRIDALLAVKAKVIAVEPQPKCISILKQKFADRIILEAVGLSDTEGELTMHLSNDSTVSSFSTDFIQKTKDRFKYSTWNDTITVPITTLDKMIEKYGVPVFCKIDVEGFELKVLEGLHQKIPMISIEYCVPELSLALHNCLAYLHALAPQAKYNYCIGEHMSFVHETWLSYQEFVAVTQGDLFINSAFGDVYCRM